MFSRFVAPIAFSLFVVSQSFCVEPVPAGERYADEIAAFQERQRETPAEAGQILCIGSSSMRMWAGRMAEDLAPLSVVPLGFGGSHFTDVINYFDELVPGYNPRAVLLYEGDNDVTDGKTPIQITRDLLTVIHMIHEFDPAIRVYVISIKPSTARAGVWPDAKKTNAMMKAVCEQDSRLSYIDVTKALLDDKGVANSVYFLKDGIHMNDDGYDEWTRMIRDVLVPAERPYER